MSRQRMIGSIGAALLLFAPLPGGLPEAGGQEATDFAPTSGGGQVIAQAVAALPDEEVVWRVVRGRGGSAEEAVFATRPLGFVLATGAPIVVVDEATGEQTRLGQGEAAAVPAGSTQRWASAGSEPGGFLAIALVPADSAAPEEGTILVEGAPFRPVAGPHDLDLVRGVLDGDETYDLPATEQEGVILATDGAVAVAVPGGEPTTLLAGEGATFVGELTVAAAGEAPGVFVAAVIGPPVEPFAVPSPPPTATTTTSTSTSTSTSTTAEPDPGADAAAGSITVEVFACPPGMGPETLAVAVCAPATGDFDVTLSGEGLEAPLTLADAEAADGAFVWSGLALGSYRVAEAVPPAGSDSYLVSAANTTGNPETGYTVAIEQENPEVRLRIYNFTDAAQSPGTPDAA